MPVLQGLLKFWPITNSHKEVLFIGELEEVLEITKVGRVRGRGWGDVYDGHWKRCTALESLVSKLDRWVAAHKRKSACSGTGMLCSAFSSSLPPSILLSSTNSHVFIPGAAQGV